MTYLPFVTTVVTTVGDWDTRFAEARRWAATWTCAGVRLATETTAGEFVTALTWPAAATTSYRIRKARWEVFIQQWLVTLYWMLHFLMSCVIRWKKIKFWLILNYWRMGCYYLSFLNSSSIWHNDIF
jgi:hypothetical protein